MSFLGGLGPFDRADADAGASDSGQVEERRAVRSDRLCVATLACSDCDAPISVGPDPLTLTDQLTCPFCRRRGPVRDFLSLAPPTRPARVIVRLTRHRLPPRG
ncbi:MAG: hypothetical protein ACLP50_27580 [Solirubrobacteraceae bacterium]